MGLNWKVLACNARADTVCLCCPTPSGTLTRNVMEFFKCSIAGVSYGQGVTEVEKSNAIR